MKKNKRMAYALAVTLLVGGTFVGTKALFKDEVKVLSELSISTGDVDLEVVEDETGWVLVRNGQELKEGTTVKDELGEDGYAQVEHPGKEVDTEAPENTATKFANNLKYGDELTKTVTVQNVGTLNATNLNITKNAETNMPEWISVETGAITDLNGDEIKKDSVIEPGEKVKVELKLTVNAAGIHNAQDSQNSDKQENKVIDLTDAWTLTANQTTK